MFASSSIKKSKILSESDRLDFLNRSDEYSSVVCLYLRCEASNILDTTIRYNDLFVRAISKCAAPRVGGDDKEITQHVSSMSSRHIRLKSLEINKGALGKEV